MASQGMYVVAEKVAGLPPFIEAADDFRVEISPSRLISWYPRGRVSATQKVVYVLELRNAAGTPLIRSVGPTTLHYWWLNIDVPNEQQARRWAKWIFDDLGNPSRTGTLGQLAANNNVDHQNLKASPDLRRPTAHDADGTPIAWDEYLQHELFGHTLRVDSENTSDIAINAEVAEKPNGSVLVAPKTRTGRD